MGPYMKMTLTRTAEDIGESVQEIMSDDDVIASKMLDILALIKAVIAAA